MAAALLTRRSVRRFGTRGHTVAATACVAATDLTLALSPGRQARAAPARYARLSPTYEFHGPLTPLPPSRQAWLALAPNFLGRTQGMALAARVTEVGAARGMGQGALAGDRQNLHALIKVVGPTLYGYLFGLGAELGVPALPFLFAACVATTANLVVTISPRSWWTTPSYSDDAGFGRGGRDASNSGKGS